MVNGSVHAKKNGRHRRIANAHCEKIHNLAGAFDGTPVAIEWFSEMTVVPKTHASLGEVTSVVCL